MDIPNKRDPFFRAQYWDDLCIGLEEKAKNAQAFSSSEKVRVGQYGTAMKEQLFDSIYHQLFVSYSKGDTKDELSLIYVDLLKAIYICDGLIKENGHVFLTHSYPKLFYKELVIFSFSYVFLKEDQVEWKKLSELSRDSHILVDKLYSLRTNMNKQFEESEFRHSAMFRPLYDIFDAPQEKRKIFLAKYLKNRGKKVADKIFCGEKLRNLINDDPEDKEYSAQYLNSSYLGDWAFEVVPLVLHFGIDDSDFEKYFYYPKDLVAMAREA